MADAAIIGRRRELEAIDAFLTDVEAATSALFLEGEAGRPRARRPPRRSSRSHRSPTSRSR